MPTLPATWWSCWSCRRTGYEDEPLERDVESLESRGDTSVFVTDAKNVSDYSRIAEGVTLDRVPAIIVLHPLKGKVAEGEELPMPNATVTYGYPRQGERDDCRRGRALRRQAALVRPGLSLAAT